MRGLRLPGQVRIPLLCAVAVCAAVACLYYLSVFLVRCAGAIVAAAFIQHTDESFEKALPEVRKAAAPVQSVILAQATANAAPCGYPSTLSFAITCAAYDDAVVRGLKTPTKSDSDPAVAKTFETISAKLRPAVQVVPLFAPPGQPQTAPGN